MSLVPQSHLSLWLGSASVLLAPRFSTRSEVERYQDQRLRALVRHAGHRVPYYRRLFERAGLNPSEFRGLEDLPRIPITTRADVQRCPPADLLADGVDPDKLVTHATFGSTGDPLTVRRTAFEERLLHAVRLRTQFDVGLRFRDRRLVVAAPAPLADHPQNGGPLWARAGLLRRDVVDCVLPANEVLSRIRQLRPDVLGGYPASLAWLAGYLTTEDRLRIRPRFILTGGEMLTPSMRRQISEAFGVAVYDSYAANEFNLIASECPRGEACYHVSEASVLAEVLDGGRPVTPGRSGELVGTALFSYAMPLIRYHLGDQVTAGNTGCRCGAPWKTFARVEGRIMDRFLLPNGDTIHPYALEVHLVSATWIRRYQVVQDRVDRITLRAVPLPNQEPSAETASGLCARLAATLGDGVRVAAELVEELPASPRAKFRPYQCLIAPNP